MKKLTLILALVLCLALCVFAFASCGKSGKDDAKTESDSASATSASTGSTTSHEHVAGAEKEIDLYPSCTSLGSKSFHCTVCHQPIPGTEEEIPMLPHVPEAEFTIIAATCKEPGMKYKVCEECGNIIESTIEDLPIDENAHSVEWNVTPATMFADGVRTGTCSLCHKPLEEVLKFTPVVYVLDSTVKDYYEIGTANIANEVLAGGKHFYPTETNLEGNDLYIEFSILWSREMTEKIEAYMATGICTTPGTSVKTSWMALSDNCSDCWCPYAGGFEACDLGRIEDGPATMGAAPKPGSTFTDYPNMSGAAADSIEWGWHRVTIKLHQELTNEDALKADETAGATAAEYKLTGTYYIDGVKLAELSYNGTGNSEDDNGVKWWGSNMEKGLFRATSNGEGGITYLDRTNGLPNVGIWFEGTANSADDPGYVVCGDIRFTCGQEPAMKVSRVNSPDAATYQIVEGVEVPGAVYFQLNDN